MYSIGVDIGGTFTDCVVVDRDGNTTLSKVLTTPEDPSEGFFAAIAGAGDRLSLPVEQLLTETERLAHGTTVGINALVTRRCATVGLIATSGHGDAIRIMDNTGRVTGVPIEEMLDFAKSGLPERFVERSRIAEVTERIDAEGDVVVPLDEEEVRVAVSRLVDAGCDALAIAFLWSHVNDKHEQRASELARSVAPDVFLSCSHEVAPRIGEYPRTVAAVMNAAIGPLMRDYVDRIVAGAQDRGFAGEVLFATCEGGVVDTETVKRYPLLTLQSGPVAGVLSCATVGRAMGFPNVITTDMGGTSLDVSVIEGGNALLTDEAVVERHQLYLRKIDVDSIGAGGGSIAWFDESLGTIRVGPQSAGSSPGPVCYGRGGTEPTVTDANLILGLLDAENELAGGLRLDYAAGKESLARLGVKVGLDAVHCASGVIEIVNSGMEDLLRRMTLQKGHDPREFAIWATGGAAGMHAGSFAKALGIHQVVVPLNDVASLWSAYGIATSEVSRTFQAPIYLHSPFDAGKLREAYASLEERAASFAHHLGSADFRTRRSAEIKYALQWYSVEIQVADGEIDVDEVVAAFERTYERRYGKDSGYPGAGMTLTAVRVVATLAWERPQLRRGRDHGTRAEPRSRPVFWQEFRQFVPTPVYAGAELSAGEPIAGPAVVEYPDTCVAVRPGQSALLDEFGNLVLSLDEKERAS